MVQYAFQQFELSTERGIAVYATTLANILHYGMCKNCGLHPNEDVIEYFKKSVIPTLKKGDKWMQQEINERDYCWLTVGQMISTNESSVEQTSFWQWALKFKQKEINDTIIAIVQDAKLAYNMDSQQPHQN